MHLQPSITFKIPALLSSLSLSACVVYPHTVPVNPPIEGSLVSVESGMPIDGAELTLSIGSDISRTYKTSSDANGRFSFTAHSDFRLIALLADAPECSTVLTIEAAGFKPRHCRWLTRHRCSVTSPKLENLGLIPERIPNSYADLSATGTGPCEDPATRMTR